MAETKVCIARLLMRLTAAAATWVHACTCMVGWREYSNWHETARIVFGPAVFHDLKYVTSQKNSISAGFKAGAAQSFFS